MIIEGEESMVDTVNTFTDAVILCQESYKGQTIKISIDGN
jgi:hypothetical protein